MNLKGMDFLKELDFTSQEITGFLDLAATLKKERKTAAEKKRLVGKNIALLFEKDSTRTRCAFEVAAKEQGAQVTYLGPIGSQMGKKESIADTARVLSRFFDGIEYRGFGQERVENLAKYASVPVWNGLTDEWHPTQMLADLLTMRENCEKPLADQKLAFMGDARNNVANSLMIGCALAGVDFRSISPKKLRTSDSVFDKACEIAKKTGAKITRTEKIGEGVQDCDFIYTDVWLSMGENPEAWEERINLLLPYRVTAETFQLTNNPESRFLHCLPAFHNRDTITGEEIFQKFGIDCMEVNDEIFESERNLAFEEAENRLHTIKAVMVATLADDNIL